MAELPVSLQRTPRLSRWLAFAPDGTVIVRTGKVEIGQGIVTALAQVVADGLGIDVARIRMAPASTDSSPDEGYTAGSMSIEQSAAALTLVCAHVRAAAIAGATTHDAVDLDVDIDPALAASGLVGPSVRSARRPIVGTSMPRLDLPGKFAGAPSFVHDMRMPGLLHGRVVRDLRPGAVLASVDESVVAHFATTVRIGGFLAAVAEREEDAVRAADRLRDACVWTPGVPVPDHDDIAHWLRRGPHVSRVVDEQGSAPVGARRITATYSRPFLAHASLTPSCAIARWNEDQVEVWSHTQGIFALRGAIADVCEVPVESVVVHHAEGSGCYGHNGADDVALDAALVARAVPGRPVRVQWSREDELALAPVGSAMVVEVEATLDDHGSITWWGSDAWSNSHVMRPGYVGAAGLLAAREVDPRRLAADTDDPGGMARNAVPIYDVGARRVRTHVKRDMPVRTSSLRALGAHANVFAIESFMDELAHAARVDPLEMRLRHLRDDRARAVLVEAATRAGWGREVAPDHGLGLAVARYKGTGGWCAVVAEVVATHEVAVRHLAVVVDVGAVVNPDGVANQVEGGAIHATSWALVEAVTLAGGRIAGTTWETYPVLRFSQVPEVAVHVMERPDDDAHGAGELVAGPVAGAIANAAFAATGLRARDLPITAARLRALAAGDER